MRHTIKKLEKNTVEITIELSPEEVQPYLLEAAERISKSMNIPGFRPGNAPYKIVEQKVGAMKVFEEALETIVRKSYIEAVLAEKLDTLGAPHIDVEKMAPGNPLVFKTTVALLPNVTKLADYRSTKNARKTITVSDDEVNRFLRDIQKSRTIETRANEPITATDRAVIDMEISREKVPLEGGSTKGHSVSMDESYYIPGFTNELLGMKEAEEKSFTLTFPAEHYQKMMAGKPADFHVTIREIYRREPPTLDDTFAKSLGQSSLEEVRKLLRDNLLREKTQKEEERMEIELLNKIVDGSQFDDIPDLLVNEEIERMRLELERGVAEQGLEWKQYLDQIKKTEAQVKLDFAPQAIRRVKIALIVREVAKKENVSVSEKEIDEELDRIASLYEKDPETKNQVYSPEHRDDFANVLKNRKTVSRLKELIVK